MKDEEAYNTHDPFEEGSTPETCLVSDCCGAPPLGLVEEEKMYTNYQHITGICSECLKQTTFEKDTSDERKH
jgi:hypothetical protein